MGWRDLLDSVGQAARSARETISPWKMLSPTDVASFAPGGGLVNAWQDSGRGWQALKQGDYGQAAVNYGSMGLNLLGEAAPWAKLAIFAGPAAKTANLAELARAQKLTERGIEPWTVHHETGWFQGADGKWRFEIPDNKATVDVAGRAALGTAAQQDPSYLSSVLRHQALYEAYPELADATTYTRMANTKPSGSYTNTPGGHYIDATAPTIEDMKSTLLHEAQHGVQNIEGFETGSNLARTSRDYGPQVQAEADAMVRMFDYNPELQQKLYPQGTESFSAKDWDEAARRVYQKMAGEVEARNVELRRNWTAADRKTDAPWMTEDVPREQQILRQR